MKRKKLLDRSSEADVTVRKSQLCSLLSKQRCVAFAGFLVNNNLKKPK